MATTREIVEQHLGSMGRVLSVTSGSTCAACLGPVSNHDLCYACYELWRRKGAPWSLADKILPMSSALNPGLWYTWLQTYKGYHQERGDLLAALVYEYTLAHRASIDALLGGSPTLWTIVPSKRGHTFVAQPFCRALCRVTTIANALTHTLSLRTGERVGRRHNELAPAGDVQCVFRDSAFEDDVAKSNLAAILHQHGLTNVRSL